MYNLGICRDSGAVYEGGSPDVGHRLHPAPSLLPISFVGLEGWQPSDDKLGYSGDIFREDYFDPVTRIRRGRVFSSRGENQPQNWHVQDTLRQDLPAAAWADGIAQQIRLITYHRDALNELRRRGAMLKLPEVILGSEPFVSFWRIVGVEASLQGEPSLTLKARSSLGDLPEIDETKIPADARDSFLKALDSVLDSVNRPDPAATVDRCRDALAVVFGAIVGDRNKDLGPAITAYVKSQQSGQDNLRSYAGKIVARLHSRVKPNEQYNRDVRSPSEDDARLAIGCLGFVLVEFGWAR